MEENGFFDFPLWSEPETNEVFEALCKENNISQSMIQDLITLIRDYQNHEKARGINGRIDEILSQEGE